MSKKDDPGKALKRAAKALKRAAGTKTSTERVRALRERRAELGLTRLDVYLHPEDHDTVRALVAALNARRGI